MWGRGQGTSAGRREPDSVPWAGGAGVGALGVGATDKVASELCGSGTGALPGGTGCFGGFIHCFLLFSQGRKGEELEGQAVTGSCRGQLAL